jgi:hypothetical protein
MLELPRSFFAPRKGIRGRGRHLVGAYALPCAAQRGKGGPCPWSQYVGPVSARSREDDSMRATRSLQARCNVFENSGKIGSSCTLEPLINWPIARSRWMRLPVFSSARGDHQTTFLARPPVSLPRESSTYSVDSRAVARAGVRVTLSPKCHTSRPELSMPARHERRICWTNRTQHHESKPAPYTGEPL